MAPPLPGGLYLVATPIGNLRDITLRALEVLAAADLIACEDMRHSPQAPRPLEITAPVTPYHDHNAAVARPKLIARLTAGAAIALISDAEHRYFRPRLQARARGTPGRQRCHRGARAFRAACGTDRQRDCKRPLPVRRLPAGKGGATPLPHCRNRWRSRDPHPVRDRTAPGRGSGRPCGGSWAARGRHLPRVDQASYEEVRRGDLADAPPRFRRRAPMCAARS